MIIDTSSHQMEKQETEDAVVLSEKQTTGGTQQDGQYLQRGKRIDNPLPRSTHHLLATHTHTHTSPFSTTYLPCTPSVQRMTLTRPFPCTLTA